MIGERRTKEKERMKERKRSEEGRDKERRILKALAYIGSSEVIIYMTAASRAHRYLKADIL